MGCSGYMGGYTGARVTLVAIEYMMTKGNQGGAKGSGKSGGARFALGALWTRATSGGPLRFAGAPWRVDPSSSPQWTTSLLSMIFNSLHLNLQSFKSA